MALYKVGNHVELPSGKTGTVINEITPHFYVVNLDDGTGRVRVKDYEITRLVGTQTLTRAGGNTVNFIPIMFDDLSTKTVTVLQGSYTDAVARLNTTHQRVNTDLASCSNATPITDRMKIAARLCFGVEMAADKEDYRRLCGYMLPVIAKIRTGITAPDFTICENDERPGWAYSMASAYSTKWIASFFAPKKMAGYVPAKRGEMMSMTWTGSQAFHSYHTASPLEGEIHVNINFVIGNPFELTSTIIHEASHKYCRSNDFHYISQGAVTSLRTLITLASAGVAQTQVQVDQMINMADKDVLSKDVRDLLSNADSLSYFIMLMSD